MAETFSGASQGTRSGEPRVQVFMPRLRRGPEDVSVDQASSVVSCSSRSVTNMCAGSWLAYQWQPLLLRTTCGVTPQAQNTGVLCDGDRDRVAEVRPREVAHAELGG